MELGRDERPERAGDGGEEIDIMEGVRQVEGRVRVVMPDFCFSGRRAMSAAVRPFRTREIVFILKAGLQWLEWSLDGKTSWFLVCVGKAPLR